MNKRKKRGFMFSEESIMSMYERIIEIIESEGPVSFHQICHEINKKENDKPIQLSQIKSVVNRKKDLFSIENDIVSIRKEKDLVSLTVSFGTFPGPYYRIHVNFKNKQVYIFEWDLDRSHERGTNTIILGSVEQFKRTIFRLKLWNWDNDYDSNMFSINSSNWYVKLVTKGSTYKSKGSDSYPKEWSKFRRAIKELIGIHLL